jgi:hypothetical protein
VGARVRGEAPSYAFILSAPREGYSMHVEAIVPSPDGRAVAVVAHGYMGEWSDTFLVKVLPADVVAARAYNDAGFAHHRRADYAGAAELFRKAAFADGAHYLAAYNLACAYARLRDPRAPAALAMAIARGAEETRKRAAKDPDFDGVRGEAWFLEAVR